MADDGPGHLATRRNLLIGIGLGTIGAGALAAPALRLSWSALASKRGASWWDRMFVSLRHGGLQDWSAIIGESFTVVGERGQSSLKLVAVKALKAAGRRPREVARSHAFAAVFEGERDRSPQGDRVYIFTHPAYPPLDIYMGEQVDLGGRVRLEAVFN